MAKSKLPKARLKPEHMAAENVKANITIRMPGDLLDAYRVEAARLGIGYQTLMQIKLREALLGNSLEQRLEKLEKAIKNRAG